MAALGFEDANADEKEDYEGKDAAPVTTTFAARGDRTSKFLLFALWRNHQSGTEGVG